MPEEIELNICEKVKSMADEYLHDELTEQEMAEISSHIEECKDCLDYIENEKKYFEEIKLAEYTPEISVSQYVMDKIIENVMTVDKPPKRRFVPVGLISAAAVVIMATVLSRSGPLNLFMQTNEGGMANDMANIVAPESAAFGGALGYSYNFDVEDEEYYDDDSAEDFVRFAARAESDNFAAQVALEAFDAGIDDIEISADESVLPLPSPRGLQIEMADEAGGGEEIPAPTREHIPPAVEVSVYESMEEYIKLNSGLEINQIYEIYFVDGRERELNSMNSMNNIEAYAVDDAHGMFNIIDKGYKLILNENLIENNIAVGEILSKNPNGEYIAVIYWFN